MHYHIYYPISINIFFSIIYRNILYVYIYILDYIIYRDILYIHI